MIGDPNQGAPRTMGQTVGVRGASFCLGFLRRNAYPLAVLLLLPQAFCWMYFFPDMLTRHCPLSMAKAVFLLGLCVTRLSAPLVLLALWLGQQAFRRGWKIRWIVFGVILFFCVFLALWNGLIWPTFGWLRSLLPIALCAFLLSLYPLAQREFAWESGSWFHRRKSARLEGVDGEATNADVQK